MEDGSEKPIAFASRTLNHAERNYAQIDKEALAIAFGVKKFHTFLIGRSFTIVTDHKPLIGLLNTTKATPEVCSPRILRWSIALGCYNYKLIHRSSTEISHADCLSRLPLPHYPENVPDIGDVLLLHSDHEFKLSPLTVANWSRHDPVISKIISYVNSGWPSPAMKNVSNDFKPFFIRKSELTVEHDCLIWGNRIVIPTKGRDSVIKLLHDTHQGASAMKAKARSYIWWPNLDQDIQSCTNRCVVCKGIQNYPPAAASSAWPIASKPWSRLHVDFAGPFYNKIFFIVVDSFSKWIDAAPVPSTSTEDAIHRLQILFATHGLPDIIVSDNATAFTSKQFIHFCAKNGIKNITSAPGHPSTNGQAEKAVQTFKNALKKALVKDKLVPSLARFLFQQHSTPNSVTGVSPAELLMKRKIKSHLDCLKPDIQKKFHVSQAKFLGKQTTNFERAFQVGDTVWAATFSESNKWMLAKVVQIISPRSFEVEVIDTGKRFRRNIDHLVSAAHDIHTYESNFDNLEKSQNLKFDELDFELCDESNQIGRPETTHTVDQTIVKSSDQNLQKSTFVEPRRSTRMTKPITRLDL